LYLEKAVDGASANVRRAIGPCTRLDDVRAIVESHGAEFVVHGSYVEPNLMRAGSDMDAFVVLKRASDMKGVMDDLVEMVTVRNRGEIKSSPVIDNELKLVFLPYVMDVKFVTSEMSEFTGRSDEHQAMLEVVWSKYPEFLAQALVPRLVYKGVSVWSHLPVQAPGGVLIPLARRDVETMDALDVTSLNANSKIALWLIRELCPVIPSAAVKIAVAVGSAYDPAIQMNAVTAIVAGAVNVLHAITGQRAEHHTTSLENALTNLVEGYLPYMHMLTPHQVERIQNELPRLVGLLKNMGLIDEDVSYPFTFHYANAAVTVWMSAMTAGMVGGSTQILQNIVQAMETPGAIDDRTVFGRVGFTGVVRQHLQTMAIHREKICNGMGKMRKSPEYKHAQRELTRIIASAFSTTRTYNSF
jgi:hypothetical protein